MFVFKTDATIIHYQWQGSIVYEIGIQHQEIIVFIYQIMMFLLKKYDHWLWTTNDQKLLLWPGHDCGRVVDLLLDWLLDDLRLVARTHLVGGHRLLMESLDCVLWVGLRVSKLCSRDDWGFLLLLLVLPKLFNLSKKWASQCLKKTSFNILIT